VQQARSMFFEAAVRWPGPFWTAVLGEISWLAGWVGWWESDGREGYEYERWRNTGALGQTVEQTNTELSIWIVQTGIKEKLHASLAHCSNIVETRSCLSTSKFMLCWRIFVGFVVILERNGHESP
jgi:hypothetical protein